jgi:hypothetical protein
VFGGGISVSRINAAFQAYNQSVAARRLGERQIDPRLIAPVILMAED